MKKNVASQAIGAQMVSATDGSAFTGSVTVYVTGDAGTQALGSVGSGACTHEGNGYHTYAPAQAETNYDLVAFTFIGSGAVPATVQVFTNFPQTGDSYARLGAPAGASVSADVAAVKAETAAIVADTNELQTDWVNGGRLDLILDARASQASVDTIDGIVDAILVDTAEIGAAGAGLTAVPWNAAWDAEVQSEVADGLAAFWTSPAALVDLMWDEAIAGHAGAGSTGEALAGATAPSAAAVADAVWDEAIAGHAVSGSTGEALSAAGAAGDPWITALPGAYSAGQAGKIVGDALDAAISSRMASYTQPTGFLAATFPTTVASTTNITAGTITTVTNLTNAPTAGDFTATMKTSIGTAVAASAVASVTAGVTVATNNDKTGYALSTAGYEAAADALLNRNVSGGSNTGRTVKQAYHFIRNKWVVAAGTLTVYDTDDTTSSWTSAVTGTAGADPITGTDPT